MKKLTPVNDPDIMGYIQNVRTKLLQPFVFAVFDLLMDCVHGNGPAQQKLFAQVHVVHHFRNARTIIEEPCRSVGIMWKLVKRKKNLSTYERGRARVGSQKDYYVALLIEEP